MTQQSAHWDLNYLWSVNGELLAPRSLLAEFRFRSLQPVPYIHVAIHRRRGVKVLLALLKATPEGWAQNRRGEILILPE